MRIDCPDLCLRYTARVIVCGVKIGPSPKCDRPPAGNGRDHADQQRGGHQQLRIDGVSASRCTRSIRTSSKVTGGRSSFAARCRARRSRRSTTRAYVLSARDVHDLRRAPSGGHRRRNGRGADGDFARHPRRADRGGRVRSGLDPQHGPAAQSAQRFVVPLRTADRSRGARLGQPPLLRADPGDRPAANWRPAWSTSASRRPCASRSCCDCRRSSGFSASGAGQARAGNPVALGNKEITHPESFLPHPSAFGPAAHVADRRSAELAARSDPRNRSDRGGGANSRIRRDSRGRRRADGPFGAPARRSGVRAGSPRADGRRFRRSPDPKRGRCGRRPRR